MRKANQGSLQQLQLRLHQHISQEGRVQTKVLLHTWRTNLARNLEQSINIIKVALQLPVGAITRLQYNFQTTTES